MHISNKNIKYVQIIHLVIIIFWMVFILPFWLVSGNNNYLYILLFGVLGWGGIFLLYSKLNDISLIKEKFLIKNLFHKLEIEKSEFVAIQKTFLSPWVFKLIFKKAGSFYFMTDYKMLVKGLSSFDLDFITNKLRNEIDGN